MKHKLFASLVRVLDVHGRIVGAGFLVQGERVATCAHVVAEALGDPEAKATTLMDREVTLDFPALADRPRLTARVVVAGDGAGTSDDLAILRIAVQLPADARPADLINKATIAQESFTAIGFPEGHDSGIWVKGICGNEHTAGLVQLALENGVPVAPGASGSAVWSDHHDGIMGVLVSRVDEGKAAAFAIPISKLTAVCEGLTLSPPKPRTWSTDLSSDLKLKRVQVLITEVADGTFEWKGDIAPNEVARLWADQNKVDVAYAPRLNKSVELSDVLLRIALHGAGGALYVHDPTSWVNRAARVVDNCLGIPWDKHSPSTAGPNTDTWGVLDFSSFQLNSGAFPPATTLPGPALATLLHEQLDGWVLDELTDKVQGLLNHNPSPELGLEIEVNLAQQMSRVWEEWRQLLRGSADVRRHFLKVILSTAVQSNSKAGQARVGKRTVQKCVVEAVVLALAVTVGLPRTFRPALGEDGQNIAFDPEGTGHLCGLELIDSVRLVQKIRFLNWEADYVFLPHYPGPGDEIPELMKHLTDDDRKVRRFDNVDAYSPLFFTNEVKLAQLIAVGVEELRLYLLGVVARWDERQQAEIDRAAGGGDATPKT